MLQRLTTANILPSAKNGLGGGSTPNNRSPVVKRLKSSALHRSKIATPLLEFNKDAF
jgi:hypothetical protein